MAENEKLVLEAIDMKSIWLQLVLSTYYEILSFTVRKSDILILLLLSKGTLSLRILRQAILDQAT